MMYDDEFGVMPSPAYLLGGAAYSDGEFQAGNPYPINTTEHDDWNHGWCDAEGYNEWSSGWSQGN